MAESKEKVKSLLMRVKEENEKAGLKLNIHETEIMASGPITLWQIDGEKVETMTDFIFLSYKIIANADCSHEIKRHLFLERKAMTNPDRVIKKQRHCFVDKGPYVKVMVVMSVVMSDHWRRQWQPTPVLLPGKSHGQRSLVGCSPWDHKESDRTG